MGYFTRRGFFKISGLPFLPMLSGQLKIVDNQTKNTGKDHPAVGQHINMATDGITYTPSEYINKLAEIDKAHPIKKDFYTQGGALEELENKFVLLTGKEAAVFVPTGTLANQLAIHVSSDEHTKVIVQEMSHVYRDEADAATIVFKKRLMPLANNHHYFTADQLHEGITYFKTGELVASDIGVVSVENPVRRADGKFIPIEELRKISAYCRSHGYKLHLDGARIFIAAAYSGVSLREYADLFDTVYVSLYKNLRAGTGAVLCGDKQTVDKIRHLIKIHGATCYSNWTNAAMAAYHLDGLPERIVQAKEKSLALLSSLREEALMSIDTISIGTNIFYLRLSKKIDAKKFTEILKDRYNIILGDMDENRVIRARINETILYRTNAEITTAFRNAVHLATVDS